MISRFDKGANRRWRGIENRHSVFFDDLPESPEIWLIRRALVHYLRGSIGERAVNDVRMPGDPPDISGAPVNILFADVEDVFKRGVGACQVTAAGVENALGFSR